jgi:general secretion pathway protein L
MSEKRIIFMSRDKAVSRWYVLNENTITDTGDSSNFETSSELTTEVVLMGSDLLIKTVEIPGTNNKQRLKAAPFAMEEHVASDIDEMHFAYRTDRNSKGIQVVAIEHERFKRYLAALDDLGIVPDRVIAAAALVDTPPDCISVMQVDDCWLINDGTTQWVTDEKTAQIQLTLAQQDDQSLLFWSAETAPDWLLDSAFDVQSESLVDPWQSLVMRLNSGISNLLTGSYSAQGPLLELSGSWRRTMIFAGILLAVHMVYMFVEMTYLQQARAGLKEEVTALYHEVVPGARVVNARSQMQQLVSQRQGGSLSDSSFPLMVQSLTEALSSYSGIQPTNLNYSAQNAELRVDLLAGNLSDFDSLKQRLEQTGYQVAMGGASAQGQQYSGRMVMRGGQ